MNKKILIIEAEGQEWKLNEAFPKWDATLRRLLGERHGRTLTQDGEDAWRVS